MYYNGDIVYKNISSASFPLIITEPPQVIPSEKKCDIYDIPGMNGELVSSMMYRGNAQVRVKFALVPDGGTSAYRSALRQILPWLSGNGELVIGDDPDAFYEVQKVEIESDDRYVLKYGELSVLFTVYPYQFLESGKSWISSPSTLQNNYDESRPVYSLSGSGHGTLTVNTKVMTFSLNLSNSLYIDTRRMITYDSNNNNRSQSISGDYDDLMFNPGINNISISSAGDLNISAFRVQPNWGIFI
jgi:phage-related protein